MIDKEQRYEDWKNLRAKTADFRAKLPEVYAEYHKKKDNIERGWISGENIEWVTEHLNLRELSNDELSTMWWSITEYFDDVLGIRDEYGEIVGWKDYNDEWEFARDTESAWQEVCNVEARRRKKLGLM